MRPSDGYVQKNGCGWGRGRPGLLKLPPLFSLFQPPLMLLRHFESAVSPFMRRSNM